MRVRHFALAGLGIIFALSSGRTSHALQKATAQGELASSEAVGFDIFLPQQHRAELEQVLAGLETPGSPTYHQWLTPAQFQSRFGIESNKVQAIEQQMASFGLTATQTSPHQIHVTGTAAAVQQALGTRLLHGVMPSGKAVVMAAKPLSLPDSIASINGAITGLSGTVRMRTHNQHQALPANRYSSVGPYWFDDLKQAYTWPSYQSYNGKGSTIGVLISGSFLQSDMDKYFNHEGLTSPKITEVPVLGGDPFNPNDDGSLEAELDVQQSGGMAPKANVIVYSIPDLTDLSIISGLAQIIDDNKVDVVNMSFGGAELFYTAAYNDGVDYTDILRAEDDLMAEGNAFGITFVASSGDSGALAAVSPACLDTPVPAHCGTFLPSVEFPASSPHVTGVGGTNLVTTYNAANPTSLNSAYVFEEAFADPLAVDIFFGSTATGGYWGSGGGNSIIFSKPAYQKLVTTSAQVRTVPDLALHMGGCPGGTIYCSPEDSADLEVFGGYYYLVIGTSASSPDFVGLTALNIQRQGGRFGNENPYIYTLAAAKGTAGAPKVFHVDIPGFNGLYTSGAAGYNRVLGNGTLYGKDFIEAPLVPSAGMPQTPTNP